MNGRVFFLFVLSFALFFSCKENGSGGTNTLYQITDEGTIYHGEKTDEVLVHMLAQPSSLHPTNGRTRIRSRILKFLSHSLLETDIRTAELIPVLTTQVPSLSADGTFIELELDPDAKWPDGKEILAEDVVFSYKVANCPLTNNPNQKVFLQYFKDITTDSDNPRKLTFHFTEYYMNNLQMLSLFQIIDQRVYDPEGVLRGFTLKQLKEGTGVEGEETLKKWAEEYNQAKYGVEPEYLNAGAGPYELESWVQNQQIILKRRENYWGQNKAVYFHHQLPPKLTFIVQRDPDALELQLANQELDVVELGGASMRRLLDDKLVNDHYVLSSRVRASWVSLPLNHKPTASGHKPFFVDKRVRQAISYALPIDELITSFIGDENFAKRIGSPVSEMSPDFHSGLKFTPHDPEKAKELLGAAGWTDSDGDLILDKMIDGKKMDFDFTFIYPSNNATLVGMASQIKEELAKVGLVVQLEGLGSADLQKKIFSHDFDMAMLGLTSTYLPFEFNQLFHSGNWPEGDNFYGFANQEADSLIQLARVERNQEARKKMVLRIQEIIYDEKPCIFLYSPTKKLAVHKRFNNGETYSIADHVILNDFKVIRP